MTKGGQFYEFSRNTRAVKSTIVHFQVRQSPHWWHLGGPFKFR